MVMTGGVFLLPSESGEKVSLRTIIMLAYAVLSVMIHDITARLGGKIPLICKWFGTEIKDNHTAKLLYMGLR